MRENFKKEIGNNLKEIYLHTTEIRGREQYHTLDYEPPIDNFIDIDTTNKTINECIQKII